jgi:6-phosphogluconolactonase
MSLSVLLHADPAAVAAAAAQRLARRIAEVQAGQGLAHVVLTGGGVGIATLRALRTAPGAEAIDWRNVELWWGDERFLPSGHADRNDTQAREALLDHVQLDWSRVHTMGAPDGPDGDDPDAAARRYAAELSAAGGQAPAFDVLLLGVGPEGHVASIFPESPASTDERPVVAVRNCPKPPPTRISMTYPTLNRAREVWFLAAGAEKAEAVGRALSGADALQVPAAGVHGADVTLWMLDEASAAGYSYDDHRPRP